MRIKNLIITISLLLLCNFVVANEVSNSWQKKASGKVKELLLKGDFEVVDTAYIKSNLGNGTRSSVKFILIDARPIKKYKKGHIPTAYAVPDTKFEKFYSSIDLLDKNKEIITYCGGWKCGKSPKVALLLKKKGWKSIKVYQEGMPSWKKSKSYIEVDLPVVKSAVKKQNGVIIDARPEKVYKKTHIPNAINIPDSKFGIYSDILPTDKSKKIIVYCGGYKCSKSHKVAKKLTELGYSKVLVYAAGLPEWKKEGLDVEKSNKKFSLAKDKDGNFIEIDGIQLVKDQEENAGMVYGDFFQKVVNGEIKNITIVDVRPKDGFDEGHIKNSINIAFEDMKPKEFVKAIMEIVNRGDKVILVCASGARATEAMEIIQDNGGDTKKIFFAGAVIDCNKNGDCKIEVNELL